MTGVLRQLGAGVRALLVFTVLLGIGYPLVVTGVAQVVFHGNANGSIVRVDGKDVASDLIGQAYTRDGKADPRWFQTRPSAVDYDATGSAASQLGPNNPDLLAAIAERRTTVAALEGVAPEQVPADALTASGSGLDPHISPAYAALQVNRVARERGLDPGRVRELVAEHTQGRTFGFLGEPRVNVVELNSALAALN